VNDLFRQYMLTQQDDADRDQFRERLLADQTLSDQLRDQEDNWIDAYATGQLPPEDAARLYQHLAETGQLDRLATAAALARPQTLKRRNRRIIPYALGIAAIVVIGFGVLLNRGREPEQLAAIRPPAEIINLRPGTLRGGGEIPKVRLTEERDTILQLIYQDVVPAGNCRVTIKSSASESKEDTVEPCGQNFHSHKVTARIPPGRYTLELATDKGELIHTYLFDVPN
jgi:hypothetical protein